MTYPDHEGNGYEGAMEERARIIKLVEALKTTDEDTKMMSMGEMFQTSAVNKTLDELIRKINE
jgi:hypothetical protein